MITARASPEDKVTSWMDLGIKWAKTVVSEELDHCLESSCGSGMLRGIDRLFRSSVVLVYRRLRRTEYKTNVPGGTAHPDPR